MKFYLQGVGMWLLMAVLAVLNGSLRQYGYARYISEPAAHIISTIICVSLFFGVMYWFMRWTAAPYGRTDAILLGLMWLVMTICFEFIFGHYVVGHSWSRLFADYNIFAGRVWVAVLLITGAGPYLAGKLLHRF